MTYDPTTRSVVLAGGRDCSGRASGESWRWDGKRWSKLSGLPAAERVCLIYSATRNLMLLLTIDSASHARAWQLRGAHWQRAGLDVPALSDATCAVDVGNQRAMLVGHAPDSLAYKTFLLVR
jgi:hypothetical protein